MDIPLEEQPFQFQGQGCFSGTGQSGEQNGCCPMPKPSASFFGTHAGPLVRQDGPRFGFPMGGSRLPGESNHPRSDGDVGQPVDDDESAGSPIVFIVIKNHWGARTDGHPGNLVQFQTRRIMLLEAVHINPVEDPVDGPIGSVWAVFDDVLATG